LAFPTGAGLELVAVERSLTIKQLSKAKQFSPRHREQIDLGEQVMTRRSSCQATLAALKRNHADRLADL